MKKIVCVMCFVLSLCSAAQAKNRVRVPALKPGDCIGILSPGSYTDSKDFAGSVELLEAHGYRVKIAPSATALYEHFAGTDRKRAADVNALFADDDVKAILCVRGGYGAARISTSSTTRP